MRETALIIPTLNCESTIERSLEIALRQNVNPYWIIVADGGSKDRTVEIALRIGRRAVSAGLNWFSFDLVSGRDQKSAIDLTFKKVRSDCVIILDPDVDLDPSWAGAASVALYSEPSGRSVYTDGAIAFHHSAWSSLRPAAGYEGVSEIVSRTPAAKRIVLGATIGSYVVQ